MISVPRQGSSKKQTNDSFIDPDFVPMKVYFIEPQNKTEAAIKKNPSETDFSYISVRGNDLSFNVSLNKCNTSLCEEERSYYK